MPLKNPRRRSVMGHNFAQVPKVTIPRSSFDRSHGYKSAFDAGPLIPIFCDEMLPGDSANLRMTALARLATPLKPFLDNLIMETFFFAVPYRLVWDNWEKFNGEQDNPADSTDFLVPQMQPQPTGVPVESIYDYMGIPPGVPNLEFNSLFFRAYNLIWNEWFRDQNLQDSAVVDKGDGPDDPLNYFLRSRGKRHDYFTSCLPFAQKGDAITIGFGDTAPVVPFGDQQPIFAVGGGSGGTAAPLAANPAPGEVLHSGSTTGGTLSWSQTKLEADLSAATAQTINQLREAFQLQRMLERDARGGTRYTEIIRSHFGVISPDARLQRPEFLGGGSTPVMITPIAQTSMSASDVQVSATPQANLAAIGTAQVMGHGFTKSFTEHCLVIGLVHIRADLTYQQGLNRMWSRQTRYDFYWPSLARLGEQAVLNKEIYADPLSDGLDDEVWGYQERYAEYRFKPSQITGAMRSTHPTSLDVWHLSQEFGTRPVLSDGFIQDNPPIDRVIAVQDEPHFVFDAYFNYRCARPMPLFGVPGMIDHF